ncbi:MAG: superoxide dismutase [Ignavibacteria bacterium]|nr:superoxide dismutase [Ignavibacteria bacterium]
MKILAIEKEVKGIDPTRLTPFLKDEALKVWDNYHTGIIREMFFRKDRNEALLILECKDENEAKKNINSLPLVKNQLIDFEIIPLKPYPGFERLFVE